MAILVTGGTGYVGSATVELLRSHNESIVVLDDLARGHRCAIDADIPFYQGKIGDKELVKRVLREHKIDACMHFAALAYVGESVRNPALYFENNVAQGISLLTSLVEAGIKRIVFSSTCATYGEPSRVPITEDMPQWPTNPYGWSKLFFERALDSFRAAYRLQFVSLRYFNAAGATEKCGEHHEPETHLIPNVLAAANGELPEVQVFGDRYPTPDGTAIRDYVHIADLADAHIRALKLLREEPSRSEFLNLGTGHGYSVMEVIQSAREITGREIRVRIEAPRAGDTARLVADHAKAKKILGWSPSSDLRTILRSAWDWHLRHPSGYANC